MDLSLITKEIRKHLELSQEEFAAKIGLTRSNLSQIEIGRNTPSVILLNDIAKIFHINIPVLFEMINSDENQLPELLEKIILSDKKSISESISKSISEASKNDKKNGAEPTPIIYGNRISDTAVPFYDLPVSAGPLGIIELGNERTEAGYIDIPIFRGCERILPVMGVSMEPVIFSGDLVGIRTIPNLSERWDFLQTGKVYLIITREDRMIKYLQESADNKDYIVCYSPSCSPFKVFKGDILQLFRVVAVARGLN